MLIRQLTATLTCLLCILTACNPETGPEFTNDAPSANHNGSDNESLATSEGSLSASFLPQFILQTGTILHETYSNFDFAASDWNRDGRPDLFAIKKSSTGTRSTEVHVLSGASNFQRFILQTGTALHETYDNFDFAVSDWNWDGRPDLFAIKKHYTGTSSTEVHILGL